MCGIVLHVTGIGRDATTREIKKAYRKLALSKHPDKFPQCSGQTPDDMTDECAQVSKEWLDISEVRERERTRDIDINIDIVRKGGGGVGGVVVMLVVTCLCQRERQRETEKDGEKERRRKLRMMTMMVLWQWFLTIRACFLFIFLSLSLSLSVQAGEVLGDEEMKGKYDRGEEVFENQGGGQRRQGGFNPFAGFGRGGGSRFHFRF